MINSNIMVNKMYKGRRPICQTCFQEMELGTVLFGKEKVSWSCSSYYWCRPILTSTCPRYRNSVSFFPETMSAEDVENHTHPIDQFEQQQTERIRKYLKENKNE